jgi:putative membrane protein
MTQHLILMAVAAPLLVLGLPSRLLLSPVFAQARPARRRRAARVLRRMVDARGLAPLQVFVLILWHLPPAVAAALASEAVHLLMHATLLAVALPFWAAVLRAGTREGASFVAAALLLFSAMTAMTLMGALLTLAPRPLYAAYPQLADQQLAGLLMWVPGTLPYLAAGVWLGVRGLARAERVAGGTHRAGGETGRQPS